MPLPGCLSSQTKFSCLGNWGLAAHQTLHLNGRKLLHAEVAHDCPEVLLLLWPLYLESIFHFKCKPLTEASHQTKPCWVHSPGNLVNLQKFAAFYFVQKERHLWNSLCTRSSGKVWWTVLIPKISWWLSFISILQSYYSNWRSILLFCLPEQSSSLGN